MNFKKFLQIAGLAIALFFSAPLFAQQSGLQDLSSVRVDELSDAQVRQFMAQIETLGLSDAQLEQVAQSRGMSATEIQKLRERVDRLKKSADKGKRESGLSSRKSDDRNQNILDTLSRRDSLSLAGQALAQLRSKIFGADLFKTTGLTFEPNLRLATPRNYVIGPDDQILIDIYGYSEASYQLTVSPEGTINIPYVGVIPISGMTIESATSRIRSRLASIYSGLRTGNTNVSVTIGNIRSIKVVLTGEVVKPGTYSLPSVATVFNALYSSGGPNQSGSFRQVEVIRGGRKIATLDVYDFLLTGELKNNVRLQDQDVIRIPTYRKRVEIVGEVKRPGIFEMVNGEDLTDLLRFAGDFTERAYRARIKVLKNTATERRISDITAAEFAVYQPSTGDKYFVDEILDRFENRVTIDGAVFRPGQFELEPGLTLGELIQKAEGLREDAFQNRGYIIRLKDDLQTELVSFDIRKILSGQTADIPLKREDIVVISSIFELKEEYFVRVEGEVQQPGQLHYAEGMTLEDAIIQAGGFREGATSQRIEVSRRVKNSNALSTSAQVAEVFQINASEDLKVASQAFVLQPFDIVAVRPSAGYETQKQVRVEGEVLYPGVYTITKKDERISDILKRAGGFTAWAYAEGASLRRSGSPKDSSGLKEEFEKYLIQQLAYKKEGSQSSAEKLTSSRDTIIVKTDFEAERNEFVGINLPAILKKPGSKVDIFLEEGDVLHIPKQLQTVKVSGEVLSPVTVVYLRNKGFKQYIANAGGFSEKAKRKRSYIKYANGAVKSTKKILFVSFHPRVKPGSEIVVPEGPGKRPFNLSEWVGVTTSIVTLLLLFNQLSN